MYYRKCWSQMEGSPCPLPGWGPPRENWSGFWTKQQPHSSKHSHTSEQNYSLTFSWNTSANTIECNHIYTWITESVLVIMAFSIIIVWQHHQQTAGNFNLLSLNGITCNLNKKSCQFGMHVSFHINIHWLLYFMISFQIVYLQYKCLSYIWLNCFWINTVYILYMYCISVSVIITLNCVLWCKTVGTNNMLSPLKSQHLENKGYVFNMFVEDIWVS